MLSRVLGERFRCPEEFLKFEVKGDLSAEARYFSLDPDILAYGRISSTAISKAGQGESSNDPLALRLEDKLAFDPDEVIDNLRLERYAADQWSATEQTLKRFYYFVRPLTNLVIRKHLKKLYTARRTETSFPHWPVDTTTEDLCNRLLLWAMQMHGVDHIPCIWFWPKGVRACALMTHDVETKAGRDFCSQLMDVDDKAEIKASFQIVPEERYSVSPQFLDQIRARGFEVGVQDLNHDGRLFDDRKVFRKRAQAINRYGREYGAKGFRSAVLYRNPDWLEDLEFSYEMSMPNVAPLDPQRGGCCTVMPYFIGDILELPVTAAQDYTLFHLLNEPSIDLWKTQLTTILSRNGLASFIVHPDYILETKERQLYEELLKYLVELRDHQSVWIGLPREIDAWWRARSKMSIVKEGQSWKIVGDGSERAVLAFAKASDGNLVWEMAEEQHSVN